ncbi:MAG TPA: helix-turn-helix transcriptional regulator, partial [Vicinamibacterales bacterium]|nr:helix-turn-helix transcriptional regulator [Vicinamibacterales bacterium]
MNEPTSLGAYLKRERERRGLALRTISESTKVSVALLEGLEADDISRWPGGIFRRAFVRSYAQCVGLDPDDVVRRFERQHQPPEPPDPTRHPYGAVLNTPGPTLAPAAEVAAPSVADLPRRARMIGTAADLTVAIVLAFGSAAAGSRLLWPVLLISAYYAVGVLLTGTSPMVALLSDQAEPLRV